MSLRSRASELMDLIMNPMRCIVPLGMSNYADGTRYMWTKKDLEFMSSFVEKNIQVRLKELWVDLKKICDEGTYNTWMIDTVLIAKENVERIQKSIEEGVQVRYYGALGSEEGLIDKAKIAAEVPASVREQSWEAFAEVLSVIADHLDNLIPPFDL